MNRSLMIAALALSYMIFAVLLNSVGTVILQSIQSFGIAQQMGSILEACKDLTIAVVSFVTASYLPRLGYRRALIIAHVVIGAACLMMANVPGFHTAELLFVAIGFGFALTKVAVYASIGLLTTSKQAHASLTNVLEGLFMLGVLAGYWLFGAFIDHRDPANLVWVRVYDVLALACLANIVLIACARLDETAAHAHQHPHGGAFVDMLRLLAAPLVYAFIAAIFFYVLIEQALGTWLPTFNREALHLPTAMSVQMTSIYAGALAVGRLGAGWLLKHISWYALLNVCLVGMALVVLVTLPLASHVQPQPDMNWLNAPLVAYVFPLIGLLMAPIYPVVNSAMLSALPVDRQAAMTGLIVVFSALGGTTGSFITGMVFAHIGGTVAFYLTLIPMVLIALALMAFRRAARLPVA